MERPVLNAVPEVCWGVSFHTGFPPDNVGLMELPGSTALRLGIHVMYCNRIWSIWRCSGKNLRHCIQIVYHVVVWKPLSATFYSRQRGGCFVTAFRCPYALLSQRVPASTQMANWTYNNQQPASMAAMLKTHQCLLQNLAYSGVWWFPHVRIKPWLGWQVF